MIAGPLKGEATGTSQEIGHYTLIDAMRGLAALAVVIFHYHHFYLRDYADRPNLPDFATMPYAGLLLPVFENGMMAVQLFWVISGFVFAHVYLDRRRTAAGFWTARVARLYPLHLATLLYVAILQIASLELAGHWQVYGNNDARHFALQLFLADTWTTLSWGLSFNGPIWSVSLEIWAYAVFFLAIPVLKRFGLGLAVLLAVLGFWIAAAPWYDLPGVRSQVFAVVGYFFLGVAAHRLHLWSPGRAISLGGAVALAVGAVLLGRAGHVPYALALGSAAIVLTLASFETALPRRGVPGLGPLGDISYGLYLTHVPLQMTVLLLVDLIAPGFRGFADSYWLLPAYVITACLLAFLVHRRFERPVGRFIRNFARRKEQHP